MAPPNTQVSGQYCLTTLGRSFGVHKRIINRWLTGNVTGEPPLTAGFASSRRYRDRQALQPAQRVGLNRRLPGRAIPFFATLRANPPIMVSPSRRATNGPPHM